MAEAREYYSEFKDLPPYEGPATANEARNSVAVLTTFAQGRFAGAVDPNVEASLPPGCEIRSTTPHGSAYWSRTAAIATVHEGKPRNFFLKLTCSDVGLTNLVGEYTSTRTICEAVPGFTPVPLAVGTYASDPDIHFYLATYVDLTDEPPDVDQLPVKVAQLHTTAVSANGKFGFSVPTNMGACVQPNKWTNSWEQCFHNLISVQFEFEQEIHGHSEDMRKMHKILLDKVVPRLLRPLETEGRSIEPRFVHGDLWDGNTSIDAETDLPVVFDASGMYAHNEFELGPWNIPRHRMYRPYIQEYQRHFPPSAPEEDFEDRLVLYRYRFNLTASSVYLDNMRFRTVATEDLKYLTSKYESGYQGTAVMKGEGSPNDATQAGAAANSG